MKIITRLLLTVALIVPFLGGSPASGQTQSDGPHVKLLLPDNKSVFRIGEPIQLILEFTSDLEGFRADTIPDEWQLTSDFIEVSPMRGVSSWLKEYHGGRRYPRHVFSTQPLSKSPTRVELYLNDTLRFDEPGKYSVRVTTHRVTPLTASHDFPPPIVLSTNVVNFEVQPMSEADEAKEVKRLSDLLDAARGWQEAKISRDLSYLTGNASAREKVRRFLNPEGRMGNYQQHINFGLYIARNRALVLRLLETVMRDPSTPVTWSLLTAVTKLRMLRDSDGTNVKTRVTPGLLSLTTDPRLVQVQQTYLAELAAGLSKRVGKSQTTTAKTILMHLPKDTKAGDPVLAEVRRILLEQFGSMHPFDQEYLLRTQWENLRDPELVPHLEKMLNYRPSGKNVHDQALKRLQEIAPEKVKQYVIAEINDRQSLVDFQLLRNLVDTSLPEVDATLLDQIRRLASSTVNSDRVYLQHKVSLAARYASINIYPHLMEIYRESGTRLSLDIRAGLLAYLAKHNEPEALPLIEQTLSEDSNGHGTNFLPALTRLHYSEGIDSMLRKRLESDEPHTVSNSSYLMSLYGPPEDQKVIEARLERWQKEWRHRPAEADATFQGIAERELIISLGQGKSWKLSPEYLKELQQACVTKICREYFQRSNTGSSP